MERMVAFCGLVCTKCSAFIATQSNDEEALKQVAAQWSEEFNTTIAPEGWKSVLLHAVLISSLILGLFYYWFAVANRYVIFLYGHLGATPFDEMTRGRYWMAGLVASGIVMGIYATANVVLGRIADLTHRGYSPPSWWQVWAVCAVPLATGIFIITMTLNQPTLPFPLATACVASTLIGLALALAPSSLAARRPAALLWLSLDGLGLVPILMLLRAVELPGKGLASPLVAYSVALGSIFVGLIWLAIMTGLRAWRGKSPPSAWAIFIAGLCLSYLLLPLIHYLLATPRYHYITASSNLFASSVSLQLGTFTIAAILAFGITRWRSRIRIPQKKRRQREW